MNNDKDDLVADSRSVLSKYRNYFSQILNVLGVNEVRQTEMHTTEPLVTVPSASEVEVAIEELKRHKSPGTDETPAELITAGCKTTCSDIHKLIISIWNKEELNQK